MTRLALGAALPLLVAGTVGSGLRVDQVHDYGWEWTFFLSAAPPKVVYEDRDYDRGSTRDTVPDGEVARGETLGGGTIYASPSDGTPIIIYVVDEGEQVRAYGLIGGP